MNELIFKINNNQKEVKKILQENNYRLIGIVNDNLKGYLILINQKKYFELREVNNKNFYITSNIADIKQYCI